MEADNKPPLPATVKLLGLASLLNDIASEMIFPLLPQFLLGMAGGNRSLLGLIEGLADSTASLLKLWSGGWSDRLGRRRGFILIGYIVAALARPLTAVATAPWHLLAVRLSDRFGKGIRTAPRDAMIAEAAGAAQRGRAFGFHRAMDHLGAAVGPALAAAFLWWQPDRLRLLFALSLVPGLLVTLLLVFGLREAKDTAPPRAQEQFRLSWKPLGGNFRLFLLALVVFTLGNSSDVFLLVRVGELGVPSALLPVLWCGFHILKSAGNLLAGPVVDRVGPRPMILLGWLVYALIYLAFALANTAWLACATFLLYAAFYSLTEPAEKTFVAQLVGPERKGLAYGWFNFAIGVAAFPANLLFGEIYDRFGALAAFGWGAGLAAAAAALLCGVRAR